MRDPYIKKDDILKLLERLAGDSQYINKKQLQKEITLKIKEYKKPKEFKIHKPYNIEHCINGIKYYRKNAEANLSFNKSYNFATSLGLDPPFSVEYRGCGKIEYISIMDIVFTLDDVGKILGVSKGTWNRYKKYGYIQQHKEIIILHSDGKRTITQNHYNLHEIYVNLSSLKSTIY